MAQGDLELRVSASTDGLQAGMTQAAALTEAQMKKIAQYVKQASDQTAALGRTSQKAANDAHAAYSSIADSAKRVEGAHAGVNRELLVLAHELSQGNFSRFGGSLLVLGERMDALKYIMSPMGATIGAVVGVAALAGEHMLKAAEEVDRFNKSVQLTGNFAGATADSVAAMASKISASSSATIGGARAALEGLAGSGRFGPDVIEQAAMAVVNYQHATGDSTEDVVKDFARMGEGVAKWAEEHNRQLHYVSSAQLDYIKHAEEEGRTDQAIAANLDALNEHLATTSSWWDRMKKSASGYLDAVASLGRPDTVGQEIEKHQKLIDGLRLSLENKGLPAFGKFYGSTDSMRSDLAAEEAIVARLKESQALAASVARSQAQHAATQEAAIAADKYVDSVLKGAKALSQRTEELKKWDAAVKARAAAGNPLSQKDIDAGRAEINKRFEDHGAVTQANEYASLMATIKAFNAQTEEQRHGMEKLTEGERFVIQTQEALEKSGRSLSQAQRDAIKADAARVASLRDVADAHAALQKAIVEDADKTVKESAAAFKAQEKAFEAFQRSGGARVGAIDEQRAQIGLNPDALARAQAKHAIDVAANQALEASGGKRINEILAEQAAQYKSIDAAMDRLKASQDAYNSDFTNGTRKAMDEYIANARNAAAEGEKLFNDAANGMTDAITQWAMTGKLSVHSMVDSIIQDLIRMQSQKAIAGLLDGASGASGFAGFFASFATAESVGGASHANGLEYVPYDGYPAILHEGERVTSRQDANVERSGGRGGPRINVDMRGMSFGAGVDASGVAQAVRTGMARTKAEIYRALSTGRA